MLESVGLLGQFSERLLRLIRRKNLQWLQWQLLQGFLQQISIGIGDILASARISATDWSLMCKDSCDGYWDPLLDQNKNFVMWFLGGTCNGSKAEIGLSNGFGDIYWDGLSVGLCDAMDHRRVP